MRRQLYLFYFILGAASLAAQTLAVTTTTTGSTVGKHDIYEINLAHTPSPAYTFPQDDVFITVAFRAPSAVTKTVEGFYFGSSKWKVRFAPQETGVYTWTLSMNTPKGSYSTTGSFTSTASANRGFLRVNPANRYGFITEADSQWFYPIGFGDIQQTTTNNWCGGGPSGPNCALTIDQYFSLYATRKNNFYRSNGQGPGAQIWETGNVNVSGSGKNQYDQLRNASLDEVFLRAHQYGFHTMLAPMADPTMLLPNFDTTQTAKLASLKNIYRYAIARWGAYTDIWEMMNEKSGVNATYWSAMLGLIQSKDPYGHPITTSYMPSSNISGLTVVQGHNYIDTATSTLDSSMANYIAVNRPTYAVAPFLLGEVGNKAPVCNYDPQRYLEYLWISAFKNAPSIFWNTSFSNNYCSGLTNMYLGPEEGTISTVFSNWMAKNYDPLAAAAAITTTPSGGQTVRGYATGTANWLGIYIKHVNSTAAVSMTVTVTVPGSGMTVTWINPESGAVLGSSAVSSGSRVLTVPSFTKWVVGSIKGASGAGVAPTITTSSPLLAATVGVPYSQTLAATGTPSSMTWTCCVSGSLPAWASFSPAGVLTGTPNASGTGTFTVTASNGIGPDATRSFSLTTSGSGSSPAVVSALACAPATLNSGAAGTCTVTLSKAAATGGSAVALSSSTALLTVPASVIVAASATTATFTATAGTIAAAQTATVTATLNGSRTASLSLVAALPSVSSLACSPATLNSGAASTCTVTLSKAAATGGSAVALSSSTALLTVPASVTVAASATTATFTATAGNIAAAQTATVTATLNGSKTASLNLVAALPSASSLACSPATLNSGAASTCTVTLSKAAATGGSAVALSSNSTLLTVPVSVTVAASATTATFTAAAGTVATAQTAMLTATLNGSTTASVNLVGALPSVSSLSCSPSTVPSGATSSCTVTISAAAPTGGMAVTLSRNSTAITIPASVAVAANATSAAFTAAAGTVNADQAATISAACSGYSASTTLTVQMPTATSPVAAYGFNEGTGTTTTDNSGHGLTAQLQGATWSSTAKYGGKALAFDGVKSYATVAASPMFQNSGSMTWSAWVYTTGTPTDASPIVTQATSTGEWLLKTGSDTGKRTFAIAVSTAPSVLTQRYSTTVVSLNTWYHVAGVYNSTARTLNIYVNGVLANGVLNGSVPSSLNSTAAALTIGKNAKGLFKGVIDELRIYTRALSQTEIQQDMTAAVSAQSSMAIQLSSAVSSAAPANLSSGADSKTTKRRSGNRVSAVTCLPGMIQAGGQTTCELRLSDSNAGGVEIGLSSSSHQLKVAPVVVVAANQDRVSFEIEADPAAVQQAVTIAAGGEGEQAQTTLQVLAAARPILTVAGKQMAKLGTSLSFHVDAFDPAGLPLQLAATDLPAGASFDAASGHFEWTPLAALAGSYRVTFSATNSARQTATAEVTIEAGTGRPRLDTSAALVCSPGAVATVRGNWLSNSGVTLVDPTGGSLELGDTRVRINGQLVPVLSSTASEVQLLCPVAPAGTSLSLVVETETAITDALTGAMREAMPAILPLNGGEETQGLISFAEKGALAMKRSFREPARPAQPGERILLWVTGLGEAAGQPWNLAVRIGSATAAVEQVRPASGYAGIYLVQVRVPDNVTAGSAVPVQVEVTGQLGERSSSPAQTMAIGYINQ